MKDYEKLLTAYEVGVQFPEVSGFEHLDTLLTRSKLADIESHLSGQQAARLEEADQKMLQQTRTFSAAIARVTELERWREDENAPPSHWWWYLDVLAETPISPGTRYELLQV